MSLVPVIREQIDFARNYTTQLIDHVPTEEWFRQPTEGVSHVAWQVGHLAMAQYRMALERVRGRRSGDAELISDAFLAHFGRDSVPDPNLPRNPSVAEIRAVFLRVHQRVLDELLDHGHALAAHPDSGQHRVRAVRGRRPLGHPCHRLLPHRGVPVMGPRPEPGQQVPEHALLEDTP